jgi:hypothetical protein
MLARGYLRSGLPLRLLAESKTLTVDVSRLTDRIGGSFVQGGDALHIAALS